MGFERLPASDTYYGLISYDTDGRERPEATGLMSQRVLQKAIEDGVTDVFFFCHGWKGDQQSARDQYEKWITAFADSEDRQHVDSHFPGFKPMYIGLHWPSLPFGDEDLRASAFAAQGVASIDSLLNGYVKKLGDRPEIREPLAVILDEARRNASPDELPEHIRQAYVSLNSALGLGSDGVDAPPDADRDEFDPQESYEASNEEGSSFGGGINLGGILGPLRQLSYWTMKKRARTIGEGGMHLFLKDLQNASPAQKFRIHLMGHSFGTIVVSSMIGGPQARAVLPRPIESLVLVQGAVSLWCYAPSIAFKVWLRNAGPGYFNHILSDGKVVGPIVTTRSRYDDAVGVLYPWASQIKGSPSFAAGQLPKYGAIGAYGIQGLAQDMQFDLSMLPATGAYNFEKGKVYNINGSQYICHKQGISGAHSDIAGPEVAHAIWAAAFAST